MTDDKTITEVSAQREPTGPVAAASLSVGNTILIVFFGVSTIWTCFSVGGLTDVYNFLNSIAGAPFLSVLGLGLVTGWRALKKWRRDKLLASQHQVIDTIANAPVHEAVETVAALRNSAPAAPPVPVVER